MGEDAAQAESGRLSAVTGSPLPPALEDSGATESILVSHQPSSHPGMVFASGDLKAKQRAEMIRGGCCVCPVRALHFVRCVC